MADAAIGFVLVTHEHPEQIAFLCHRLTQLFDGPPIALHHDFSQCELDAGTLPEQVAVVQDWAPTAWGKFSVVNGYLKALRLLLHHAEPQWIVYLSAADYPVKPARRIFEDLASIGADALMDFRWVGEGAVPAPNAKSMAAPFHSAQWIRSAQERYIGFDVLPYRIRKHVGLANRTLYVRNALTTRLLTPFHGTFQPYAGDVWHSLNLRAARVLATEDVLSERLARHYHRRACSDESYFQTVLLNRPELRVENDNRRFTIWEPGARSPRPITEQDVPAMLTSSAHFARKFPFDKDLYRAVDDAVALGLVALPR